MNIRSVARHRLSMALLTLVLIGARASTAQLTVGPDAPPRTTVAASFDEAEHEKAVRFLENIQGHMYRSLGRQPPVYDSAFVERLGKTYAESRRMTPEQTKVFLESFAKAAQTKLRSRYEDLMGYLILKSLNDQISEAIHSSSIKLRGVPVFGTLPTRRVNARTFAVPGSTNVVIAFEDQAFLFALLFTKAVAYAMPVRHDPEKTIVFSNCEAGHPTADRG